MRMLVSETLEKHHEDVGIRHTLENHHEDVDIRDSREAP